MFQKLVLKIISILPKEVSYNIYICNTNIIFIIGRMRLNVLRHYLDTCNRVIIHVLSQSVKYRTRPCLEYKVNIKWFHIVFVNGVMCFYLAIGVTI